MTTVVPSHKFDGCGCLSRRVNLQTRTSPQLNDSVFILRLQPHSLLFSSLILIHLFINLLKSLLK